MTRFFPAIWPLLAGVILFASHAVTPHRLSAEETPQLGQAQTLSAAFRSAAKSVAPAVITVVAQESQYRQYTDGTQIYEKQVLEDGSIGSGVIIHNSGVVLTNSHVLEGADRILIRMADGTEYETHDLRRDEFSDVAILRIRNPPELHVAKLGDSDKSEIGDWVIAIGSPFELEATVSAGIISGKNRRLEKIRRGKLMQTDAAINPGNSGGPLVNLQGEIIGINTAIASSSGGYQGIGFAIPINNARWVINQLAEYGEVKRGYLGVALEEFSPRDARKRGMAPVKGVIVTRVYPKTPAADSGLLEDDVIVEFAGMPVGDTRDLQGLVERKEAGTRHPLKIIRDGRTEKLDIRVERLPAKNSVSRSGGRG